MTFSGVHWVIVTGLWWGCAGGAGQRSPVTGNGNEPAAAVDALGEPDPRRLPEKATFNDLVSLANQLDQDDRGESGAGCLLRGPSSSAASWRLEGDVVPAVRPLPQPTEDLDRVLAADAGPVLVLSRWAELGQRPYAMAVALMTDLPLRSADGLSVLVLTNRGLYWRGTEEGELWQGPGGAPWWPPPPELNQRLADQRAVVVATEGGVSLRRLGRVLAALPARLPVSLAVGLAQDMTVPPRPDPPPDRGTGLCPGGLPSLPAEEPVGELAPAALMEVLRPAGETLRDCLVRSPGLHAPRGRVEVALRIDESGKVADACLVTDELGGTPWRSCVLQVLRPLQFPRPLPVGTVDVILPLRLEPRFPRALCEP
jgi:hypothetical protein